MRAGMKIESAIVYWLVYPPVTRVTLGWFPVAELLLLINLTCGTHRSPDRCLSLFKIYWGDQQHPGVGATFYHCRCSQNVRYVPLFMTIVNVLLWDTKHPLDYCTYACLSRKTSTLIMKPWVIPPVCFTLKWTQVKNSQLTTWLAGQIPNCLSPGHPRDRRVY